MILTTHIILIAVIVILVISSQQDKVKHRKIESDLLNRIMAKDLEDLAVHKPQLDSTPTDAIKMVKEENKLAKFGAKIEEEKAKYAGYPIT